MDNSELLGFTVYYSDRIQKLFRVVPWFDHWLVTRLGLFKYDRFGENETDKPIGIYRNKNFIIVCSWVDYRKSVRVETIQEYNKRIGLS